MLGLAATSANAAVILYDFNASASPNTDWNSTTKTSPTITHPNPQPKSCFRVFRGRIKKGAKWYYSLMGDFSKSVAFTQGGV